MLSCWNVPLHECWCETSLYIHKFMQICIYACMLICMTPKGTCRRDCIHGGWGGYRWIGHPWGAGHITELILREARYDHHCQISQRTGRQYSALPFISNQGTTSRSVLKKKFFVKISSIAPSGERIGRKPLLVIEASYNKGSPRPKTSAKKWITFFFLQKLFTKIMLKEKGPKSLSNEFLQKETKLKCQW